MDIEYTPTRTTDAPFSATLPPQELRDIVYKAYFDKQTTGILRHPHGPPKNPALLNVTKELRDQGGIWNMVHWTLNTLDFSRKTTVGDNDLHSTFRQLRGREHFPALHVVVDGGWDMRLDQLTNFATLFTSPSSLLREGRVEQQRTCVQEIEARVREIKAKETSIPGYVEAYPQKRYSAMAFGLRVSFRAVQRKNDHTPSLTHRLPFLVQRVAQLGDELARNGVRDEESVRRAVYR